MKKLIATLICLVVLSMTALPVAAQRRARWNDRPVYNTGYDSRYDNSVYNDNNDNYRTGRTRRVCGDSRGRLPSPLP